MTLAGLVSGDFGPALDQDSAVVKVWTTTSQGGVTVHEVEPKPTDAFRAGDWTIAIDYGLAERLQAMRHACLPNETGGVLTGVVDIPAKRIHLVDAKPAPTDSVGSVGGFTRGTAGVQDYLENIQKRTGGQVRYVGEWHSHPPHAATYLSATDLIQIDWLASLFDMDTLPALMVIVGDQDIRIILANREAEPSGDPVSDAGRRAAGGQQ